MFVLKLSCKKIIIIKKSPFEFVFKCCGFTKVILYLVEKLVWNVIKAFWYTNSIFGPIGDNALKFKLVFNKILRKLVYK